MKIIILTFNLTALIQVVIILTMWAEDNSTNRVAIAVVTPVAVNTLTVVVVEVPTPVITHILVAVVISKGKNVL